jgi:alkanesulfonate monooxygenase SsuD/methylene tetrahydromethanopterin reductase-like flavin-dependent oxidoreductase (luciferase family)
VGVGAVELGIFIQGYLPQSRRSSTPDAEHWVLMRELEIAVAADRAGIKYIWASEHHFLDEYSHLSASDVVLGYLAHATERAHIGSGIFNPLPQVNHPAKVAERVAMLDHLSGNRFEFGTGRGAGSHEILGFLPGMEDLSHTREIWEDVIGEFPKMWLQDEYQGYVGKYWSLPPRKILPKPWGPGHPAMWYAAGNTSSYEMAARKGLGVLGFSVGSVPELEPVLANYKKAIVNAEPIGAFVNDNVMVTTKAFVHEDSAQAFAGAAAAKMNEVQSQSFRYHDTFPHPDGVPTWPELIPDFSPETMQAMSSVGSVICGDPDEALRQIRMWESAGADQLVFAMHPGAPDDTIFETIRLLGEHVIPKVDTDPVHRTSRFREAAARGS